MNNTNDKLSSGLKIVINVLVVLLIVSLLGLAGRYIYLNYIRNNDSTVTVSENVIEESGKTDDISDAQDEESTGNDSADDSDEPTADAETENPGTAVNSSGIRVEQKGNDTNNSQNTSENIFGNTSGGETQQGRVEAPTIELDKNHTGHNEKFEAFGMLPGDTVTKYYCVNVRHDYDVKVYFETEVTEEVKHLGDVLNIKVTDVSDKADTNAVVAEGTFNGTKGKSYPVQLKENNNDYTRKYYRIDVSVDTSVDNSYQGAALTADFKWYVTDEEYHAMLAKKPIIPGITDTETSGVPKTGDMFDKILWALLLGSALLLIVSVTAKRRWEAK